MQTFNDRYPDLFNKDADNTDMEQIVSDLENLARPLATMSMPEEYHARIKRALLAQALQRHQKSPISLFRPAFLFTGRRYRWLSLGIVLLCLLFVSSTVLAAINPSLVDQAFHWYDKNAPASQHGVVGQKVNITKSLCGFTFTIGRVYADQNQILVGMEIVPPAAQKRYPANWKGPWDLPLAQFNVEGSINGGPEIGSGEVFSGTPFGAPEGTIYTFDTPQLAKNVQQIHVKVYLTTAFYEVAGGYTYAQPPIQTTCPFKKERVPGTSDSTEFAYPLNAQAEVNIPYTPGYVLQLNQTKRSDNGEITFKKISVSQVTAYVYVKSSIALDDGVFLSVNGQEAEWNGTGWNATGGNDHEGTLFIFQSGKLFDQHGAHARLTLMKLSDRDKEDPIIFDFTLP